MILNLLHSPGMRIQVIGTRFLLSTFSVAVTTESHVIWEIKTSLDAVTSPRSPAPIEQYLVVKQTLLSVVLNLSCRTIVPCWFSTVTAKDLHLG